MAAELGDHEKLQTLLDSGTPVSPEALAYALGMASRNGHLEVVETLLKVSFCPKLLTGCKEPKCDPSVAENYALCWASRNGYPDIVRLLLADKRVNPAACDNYPVRLASEFGHAVRVTPNNTETNNRTWSNCCCRGKK